jgi:Domain of unknown function (DUF4124)
MKPHHLFILLCLSQAGLAQAEIYKRVDANGHVTYSSEPLKGAKKLELKALPTVPGTRTSNRSTPEDFPKVDSQTQKSRDATRRIILEDELATEESLLATALENLKSVESNPEPIIGADGIPFRNAGKYAEKLKAAQESVALHEQNIKALKIEISNLK